MKFFLEKVSFHCTSFVFVHSRFGFLLHSEGELRKTNHLIKWLSSERNIQYIWTMRVGKTMAQKPFKFGTLLHDYNCPTNEVAEGLRFLFAN